MPSLCNAEKEFWVDNLVTCTQADWIINSKYFFCMEKKAYISPEVEVIEIAVEKGFAQSGGAGESEWENW